MLKAMVTILALVAAASAEPLLFNAPLYASPYTSAAYVSPAAAYVSPTTAYVSPTTAYVSPTTAYVSPSARVVAPMNPALPAALPAVPAAYPAGVPYSSMSAYSYGSSYSVQDYLPTIVNANPSLTYSAAYSLPYAYAADYYYRR